MFLTIYPWNFLYPTNPPVIIFFMTAVYSLGILIPLSDLKIP
jgi:hypothetical protein